jgi:cysteinyl-tRNA synthetase
LAIIGPLPLKLRNTLTRKIEIFDAPRDRAVKMFTCGPSVYKPQHLGNYRTFLYEDILHRLLLYLGYSVQRVINFTDVEDKALHEAEMRGVDSLEAVTAPVIEQFLADARRLHIMLPAHIPRSSTSVDTAASIIEALIAQGHAYRYRGNIYYDPLTFSGFGKLFGLDMSRWPKKKKRFSKDTYPGQRWNLGDFILWHGCSARQTLGCWDSAIGRGRPSWNVQDPAIILKHLGQQIDIHCGGIDNLYRHHDYTIAVLEGYSGEAPLSRYWLHGEHLLVDGRKMSKKKGNVSYPLDLARKGLSDRDIRFFLIDGHYRSKKNLTDTALQRCCDRRSAMKTRLEALTADAVRDEGMPNRANEHAHGFLEAFEAGICNDLHVDSAIRAVEKQIEGLMSRHQALPLARDDQAEVYKAMRCIDSVLNIGLID